MPATSHVPWLDRPLAEEFLAFNLLLSRLMHVSRQARMDEDPRVEQVGRDRLNRHLESARLMAIAPGESLVKGLEDPALPIFMASPRVFADLTLRCGLLPLAPSIRRVITREERDALRSEFEDGELEFAKVSAPKLWPGDGSAVPLALGTLRAQVLGLGEQVLFFAAQQASPPVRCRARLRLPVGLKAHFSQLPLALRDGPTSLALSRAVMQEFNPEWMSLFPNSG